MRDRTMQRRVIFFLGIFLSFAMVASLITPLLYNQQNLVDPQTRATSTPRPTQPAPPDTTLINFDSTYLHPSGLFTAAIPTGFSVRNEFNSTGEAQTILENPASLSVIEIRVIRPTEGIELTPQGLGGQFTDAWLQSSWASYTSWDEDARRVDGDQLIIDFTLTQRGQTYIARQVAFTDDTWIYTIRTVTPSNANEALQYILTNEVESFQTVERYVGSRLEWDGYFDDTADHLLRFPGEWTVVDSANGAPASVAGDGTQVRVETTTATIDSETAASDYVAGLRSNVSVLSVTPVEQYGTTGYRVAYTVPTVDGPTQSGAVLLLNGETTTHVVNVLLENVADTDLNSVDTSLDGVDPAIVNALGILDTFSLFPGLEVANS